MSIFGAIRDAIFGGPAKAEEAPRPAATDAAPAPTVTAQASPAPASAAKPAAASAPAAAAPAAKVDVAKVLDAIDADEDLDWRKSIVDLMKLLGIDSSLANRKELATELGYTGDLDGSAEMNIWLHKAVMRELAANGGKVPADLTD